MFVRILATLLAFLPSFANAKTSLRASVDQVAGDTGAGLAKSNLPSLAGELINGALGLLGVVLLILLVYGGYTWMMASGNEEEVTKAKNIIRDAIIGLIIIMAAGAITYFITSKLESAI